MFSSHSSFLTYFYNLRRSGMKLGLEHTFELLDKIGNPQNNLKMIHIAGTNGKGSCSAIIENILRISGRKTGIYTSPHLINFNERIKVNGKPISNSEIALFFKKYKVNIEKIESTFFEVSTVMALDHFSNNAVDVAIIETGLGGRLDSTNVIKPKISIITHISLDHSDILGDSISKIAEEKSGIIKKNTPLIISKQSNIVKEVLYNKSQIKSAPIFEVKSLSNISLSLSGTSFVYKSKFYRTSLIGIHQAHNASVAIEAVRKYDEEIKDDLITEGLLTVNWPGRIQKIHKNIFFDVAHNQQSIKSLISTIKIIFPKKLLFGLFCLKGDKDLELIAKELHNVFNKLFICQDKNNFLLNKNSLSKKLNYYNVQNEIIESIEVGIKKIKFLSSNNGVGLIFGSHYIAEDIYNGFQISFDKVDI